MHHCVVVNPTSVDNGQVDIIELAELFEIVFHIELGDVYRTFTQNCLDLCEFQEQLNELTEP